MTWHLETGSLRKSNLFPQDHQTIAQHLRCKHDLTLASYKEGKYQWEATPQKIRKATEENAADNDDEEEEEEEDDIVLILSDDDDGDDGEESVDSRNEVDSTAESLLPPTAMAAKVSANSDSVEPDSSPLLRSSPAKIRLEDQTKPPKIREGVQSDAANKTPSPRTAIDPRVLQFREGQTTASASHWSHFVQFLK